MIKEENRAYSDFEPRVFCNEKYSDILPEIYVPKKNITVPLTPDCKKEYDEFGRVVYAYSTFINSNKKYEEFFITYDKNGNITSVERARFSTKIIEILEYDEFGNLVKIYDNLGNKRVIKYNKDNNILSDECRNPFNLMEYKYFYYDDHGRVIKIEYYHELMSCKYVEEWSYYDDNSIKHYKNQGAFDKEYYFNEDGIKVIAEGSKIQYTYKTSYKRIKFEVIVNADNSYDIYSLSGQKASISKDGTGFIYMDGKKYTLSVEETNVELPAESDNASIVYFTSTFGSFYYYGFKEIHTHHHIYDDSGKLIGDLYTTKETKQGDIYIPVFGSIYKYNENGKIEEERLIHNCVNTDFGKEQYNKIVYVYGENNSLIEKRLYMNDIHTTSYVYENEKVVLIKHKEFEYAYDDNGNKVLINAPKYEEVSKDEYSARIIKELLGVKNYTKNGSVVTYTYKDKSNNFYLDLVYEIIEDLGDRTKLIFEGFLKYDKSVGAVAEELGVSSISKSKRVLLDPVCRKIRRHYRARLNTFIKEHNLESVNTKITSIEELNLSARLYHVLCCAYIETVDDILKLNYKDLMEIRNFGVGSYKELMDALKLKGFDTSRLEPEKS